MARRCGYRPARSICGLASQVRRTDAYLSAAARALTALATSHFQTWRGDA
jgi:hypothetical protein